MQTLGTTSGAAEAGAATSEGRKTISRAARWGTIAAMAAILGVSLFLRAWGMNFGLPYIYHPDEPTIMNRALQIGHPSYNVHYYLYPSGLFYMEWAATKIADVLHNSSSIHHAAVQMLGPAMKSKVSWEYLAGRSISLILGTLTVLLVFLLGQALFGTRAGLLAAVAMVLSPIHVKMSHYAVTDAPALFFWVLGLWLAVRFYKEKKLWMVAGSALAAGLAAGVKYDYGLVIVATAIAVVALDWRVVLPANWVKNWKLWACFIGLPVGFLVLNPFFPVNWHAVIGGLRFEQKHYADGQIGFESSNNWFGYPAYLWQEGIGAISMLAAALGLARWGKRISWGPVIIVVPTLLYYISVSQLIVNFNRTTLPFLPTVAVLAGFGLDWLLVGLAGLLQGRQTTAARATGSVNALVSLGALVAVVAVAVQPFPVDAAMDQQFTRTDSRTIALNWIVNHPDIIPQGSRIAVENSYPPLDPKKYTLTTVQVGQPDALTKVGSLSQRPLSAYTASHDDYVIADSLVYQNYWNDPLHPQVTAAARAFYTALFKWQLVWSYDPGPQGQPGPIIKIYRAAPDFAVQP